MSSINTGASGLALALALALIGCGGGDGTVAATPLPAKLSCSQLATLSIPASSIGMPTQGAVMTSTRTVPASGTGTAALGEYCLALGEILPMDSTAPKIQFQVALPTAWNGKAVMMGGGGTNGTIPSLTASPTPTAASPLARGYAVFAGDSGHQNSPQVDPSAFYLNNEALKNYVGDALKKTRDAAVTVIQGAYASAPARAYFIGGSTGGREGLNVAARWPADWDGVVSLYPAIDYSASRLAYLAMAQTFRQPGGWVNRAKRLALRRAALAACDPLDGLADGLISNVSGCNATFHPATALLDGAPLRCAGGADTGDTCLSDAQIASIEKMNSAISFNFALAGGPQSYPGLNAYFSDLGVPGTSTITSLMANLAPLGDAPPAFPLTAAMGLVATNVDGYVRYGIARDANFNMFTMNPIDPGPYAARWSELSAIESLIYNLDGFAARGGKLLLMHGTEDMIVTPRNTEAYFAQLQSRMGVATVDTFARFYLVPGMAHSVSSTFYAAWDVLTAIDDWVDKGSDPKASQVVMDLLGVPGRTRPLCIYPSWPKYKGSGDANAAASFTCATS